MRILHRFFRIVAHRYGAYVGHGFVRAVLNKQPRVFAYALYFQPVFGGIAAAAAVLRSVIVLHIAAAAVCRGRGFGRYLHRVAQVVPAARAARKHKRRQRKRKQYNCSFFHGILLSVKKRPALCGQGTCTRVWLIRN